MNRNGLKYYHAETARFQDIKIKRLKKKYGCEGYAVYSYVENEIYRVEGSYIKFDEDQAFDCAEYWALEEDKVYDIINFCAEIGLFNTQLWEEQSILSSRYIQDSYLQICRRAKKQTAIPDGLAIAAEEGSQPQAAQNQPLPASAQPAPVKTEAQTQHAGNQLPQNSAEFRETPQKPANFRAKIIENKNNPPSYSPQRGETMKEEIQETLSRIAARTAQTAPAEQTEKRRNTNGLLYYLEKYHIPQKEAEEILALTRYGEIGHPVWELFQEIDRSRGKITMPGRFLLARLRAS